ncbi:MAG TPA: hypothetical protein VH583_18570 [Vicinamibacterales bacterium]
MSLRGAEHGRTFANLIFEILLVAIGVFLALWVNNWNEERRHRAQAQAALRNFLGEMETNRRATEGNRHYHDTLARELAGFLQRTKAPSEERFQKEVHYEGARPVIYEHTAWDLALATQALSYLEPDLAFDISKVYTLQNAVLTLENSFLASAFTRPTLASGDMKDLASALAIYLGDINQQEPIIVGQYDKVIPEIRRALSAPAHAP